MLIRTGGPDDYPAIRRVARVTWAAAYAGFITAHNQRAFLNRAYSDPWLAKRHQRPGGRLVVAEVNGRIVGFATSVERTADAAELTSLYVHPEYQGHGVGSALLLHELRALAGRGIRVLVLSALRENRAARRFYERHGFQPIAQQTTPLGDQRIVEVVYAREMLEEAGPRDSEWGEQRTNVHHQRSGVRPTTPRAR